MEFLVLQAPNRVAGMEGRADFCTDSSADALSLAVVSLFFPVPPVENGFFQKVGETPTLLD
jgi:hypothetical protein